MQKIIPIILCGGSGTRLWPLSSDLNPKQFLKIIEEDSLFQKTLKRVSSEDFGKPIVVSNEKYKFTIEKQLDALEMDATIILETFSKNTAPAIAIACRQLEDDDLALVLPSDHLMDDEGFIPSILEGRQLALQNKIVTFGVKPEFPSTAYGYIQKDDHNSSNDIKQFVEKPELNIAEKYLEEGNFYWNAGIFLFKALVFMQELKKYKSSVYSIITEMDIGVSHSVIKADDPELETCESCSIDYAIMEHTSIGAIVELKTSWSDVGSWDSLWKSSKQNNYGVTITGQVQDSHSKNSYLYNEDKLLVTSGLENIILINTKDVTLVMNKDDSENLKETVSDLKKTQEHMFSNPSFEERPWGNFLTLEESDCFKVKKLVVNPFQQLSLQSHQHRSEHWVVVKGKAEVIKGDEVIVLSSNESIFIPSGTIHSIKNPTGETLQIVEVQIGSYFGEDDIVRYDDKYGRVKKP